MKKARKKKVAIGRNLLAVAAHLRSGAGPVPNRRSNGRMKTRGAQKRAALREHEGAR